MNTSSSVCIFSRWLVGLGLLIGAMGCADVMTYSRDSHRQGMKLYQQGNYADAAGAFRNSVRQNPRNYQGYYYLGASYEQLGQHQQAIASYRTARQTIGLTIEGREDRAFRHKILDSLASAIARSDQRDIETNAVQREAQEKQSGESWLLLAKVYAYRGDADSAIDAYNRAALLEPHNFEIAKEYGLYLERVGQRQRAEQPLRRAYSLNPQDDQVNQALRRIGVVPGPAIKDEDQLARPLIPKGPIPPVRLPGFGGEGSSQPPSDSTVQAPRD